MSRNQVVVMIGTFLAIGSSSLVMPFLPRYLVELGVTENLFTWSGVTYAVTFVIAAVLSPIWGNLADRSGRKPIMVRSGFGIAIAWFLISMATSPYHVFFGRVLFGCASGFVPGAIAFLSTSLPEDQVARGLARLATVMAAATIMGPLIGGALADLFSIRVTIQIAGTVLALATVMVHVMVQENFTPAAGKRTSVTEDLRVAFSHRHMAAVLLTTLLSSASIQALEPILATFVPSLRQEAFLGEAVRLLFGRSDADTFMAGLIFALPGLAIILFAQRWTGVGKRIGFPKLITFAMLGAGLLSLPQYFVTTAATLMVLRFSYGACMAAVQPSIGTTLAGLAHPSFRGRAFSINTSMSLMGMVTGPVIGGLVADGIGQRAVFVFAGLTLLGAAAWFRSVMVKEPAAGLQAGAPADGPASTSA